MKVDLAELHGLINQFPVTDEVSKKELQNLKDAFALVFAVSSSLGIIKR